MTKGKREKIEEGFREGGRGINDANSVSGMRMMDPQKSTEMKLAQIQLQAGQPDGSLFGYNAVGHQQLKFIECKKNKGLKVVPVFYHVDPSDVQNQTGPF